jgi:hypothetical protein
VTSWDDVEKYKIWGLDGNVATLAIQTAFLEGMKKLKERANKCIDQGGMYFEE